MTKEAPVRKTGIMKDATETLSLPILCQAESIVRKKTLETNHEWVGYVSLESGEFHTLFEGNKFKATMNTAELVADKWNPNDAMIHSHIQQAGSWTHTIRVDLNFIAYQNFIPTSIIVEADQSIVLKQPKDYKLPDMNREEIEETYQGIGNILYGKGMSVLEAEEIALLSIAHILDINMYFGRSMNQLHRKKLTTAHQQLLQQHVFYPTPLL